MGAGEDDPQASDREKPQHPVYLDAFWMDQSEVSNRQYAQCQAEGGCVRDMRSGDSSLTRTDYLGNPEYDTYPTLIYLVQDAEEYCAWAGRRLPSEAEWEKAARGPDGRLYPWGNENLNCEYANYGNCVGDTAAAGSHPAGAGPYGALHMSGNVWEWVSDWYDPDYYPAAPARNPSGPAAGEYKIRRGGGWRSLDDHLRLTNRASGAPKHYFDGQMGFRCATSLATAKPAATAKP
jgi:formylglycine-generating enzyme required for sulfatase activity